MSSFAGRMASRPVLRAVSRMQKESRFCARARGTFANRHSTSYLRPASLAVAFRLHEGRKQLYSQGSESHYDFKPQRRAPPADLSEALKMIDEQVKKHKIMLYMKGTPSQPQCGFSAQVVRVLHASGVDFDSVNVLDYPMIREGVKKYSEWPTVPQLYVDSSFVGGCDIVTSLFQSGELAKILEKSTEKK